jgi:hypothetical protein
VAAQVSRKLIHIELAMVTVNTKQAERKNGRDSEGRHPNVHGNGKMERKRRDERDGVLTFGKR